MKTLVPRGLRLAFLAHGRTTPSLPLHAEWAEVRHFDVAQGWARPTAEAALFRPDITFLVLDDAFTPAAVKSLAGLKVGMVTRPPHGAQGPWDLKQWRKQALDALTWFEPPPSGEASPLAIVPLPVDRASLPPPDFSKRRVVVPRWAAPSPDVLARLCKECDDVVVLEPEGSTARHLDLLDACGIFVYTAYDAIGRLDPLPLQALARGMLVITTTGFPPLWGVEPEDDFLVRTEDKLLGTLDEVRRIPETSRAVRMRAWQKTAEFFDADEVFQRLTVDVLLALDASRLNRDADSRLRRVK